MSEVRRRRVLGMGRGPGPRLRLAMLVVGVLSLFVVLVASGAVSPERVRDWVREVGVAAPIVFVAVSALLTVAVVPGPILAGAAGLLFGTALGTPIAILSATLGASLCCLIARFVAGDAVEEIGGPRTRQIAAWVQRRGFVSVFYARLAPGMPFAMVSYATGLTTIPVLTMAAATAIGTAPRTFAYVALGGSFGDLSSPEAIAALAIIVVMGATGLLVVRRDLRRERAAARAAGPPGEDLVRSPDPADA